MPKPQRVRPSTPVLPTHARRQNLSLVLQALYSRGPMSRADLARTLGLTKVTVSELVSSLLDSGHAVEVGRTTEGRMGKPGILIDVNRSGLQTIGIDLSDHRALHAAVLDLDGTVLARAQRPFLLEEHTPGAATTTPAPRDGAAALALVLELVAECQAAATAPVLGIGIGTPGIVGRDGVVHTAPNLGWIDLPLRERVAVASGLPVSVCNDADAAAHAEYSLGDGGDDLILVKIGRGVGCGLIVGGSRVRGAHLAAGEIGHVVVGTDGGTPCRCGKVGCLETWVSAPHLERALASATTARLPGRAGSAGTVDAPGPVDDPGDLGADPLAAAGERLAIALAPVVAALDLADVVLCGPEHLVVPALVDAVERTLRARMLVRTESELRVRRVAEPDDIVVRGAAALVLWDQLGVA